MLRGIYKPRLVQPYRSTLLSRLLMKLYKSKKLLNIDDNPKTIKGQKYKYMTAILYLAPARTSGFNVCPLASAGCKASCLNTAGRGQWAQFN